VESIFIKVEPGGFKFISYEGFQVAVAYQVKAYFNEGSLA